MIRFAVAALLVASGVVVSQTTASAAPGPVTKPAAKPTLEQVRQQVATLRDQAETATEKYNAAKESQASLTVRLAAAQTKLTEQREAVAKARTALGQIAVDTYKAGDLATLSLFLGDDPQGYVDANGLLMSLGDRRANAAGELLHQRQQLVSTMTDIQEQQQRLAQTQHDLAESKSEVEKKLAEAGALLGRLTSEERGRLAQANGSRNNASLKDLGVNVPANGSAKCSDVPMGTLDARVSKVIAYACAQLGDPYQWAASGPSRFDCSGLTMMAWKQAGVSLPHNAAMQATYGTTVSMDNLKAGDLVFFHHPIGHVGIYLGSGAMIHAPQTGDVVKISPMRYTGDFATAVRL